MEGLSGEVLLLVVYLLQEVKVLLFLFVLFGEGDSQSQVLQVPRVSVA